MRVKGGAKRCALCSSGKCSFVEAPATSARRWPQTENVSYSRLEIGQVAYLNQVIGQLEGLARVEGVAVKKAALEDFAKQLRTEHGL